MFSGVFFASQRGQLVSVEDCRNVVLVRVVIPGNQSNSHKQTYRWWCWSGFIYFFTDWTFSVDCECGLYAKMWSQMPWMVGELKAGSSVPYMSSCFVWLFLLFCLTVCFTFSNSVTNTRFPERIRTRYHKQAQSQVSNYSMTPKTWCFCFISQDRCLIPLGSSSPGLTPDKIRIPYVGCRSCEAACVSLAGAWTRSTDSDLLVASLLCLLCSLVTLVIHTVEVSKQRSQRWDRKVPAAPCSG